MSKLNCIKDIKFQTAEDYVLNLIEKGRLSFGRAAEILDLSIYDIQDIAKSKGVILGATLEQYQKSKKFVKELIGKSKK